MFTIYLFEMKQRENESLLKQITIKIVGEL